ncbi:D-tyrosyl-tRNA(Tyr) deacylase [Coprothermobacteraceae bacterium]|nr:D-tyrosyl-tRNA(Tyr) deacylase [Coprothermobacteraceae bacterium]
MILLLNRVSWASLTCDGEKVGEIGTGLVCFVGFEKGDDREKLAKAARRVVELRIFGDEEGRLNKSLEDIKGGLMVVSNFTLAGVNDKGRRLSFDSAMPFDEAKSMFEAFCGCFALEQRVFSVFGSYMQVAMTHDGPVNVVLRL